MPVAAATIAVSPLDSVKMDERKRHATDDIGSTPPLKRQAISVNGASSHADIDLPWNDDIDRYQKDAILRQMREYKREKNLLEQQLVALTKKAESHDDHIRLIDAWFLQRLDEMALLTNASPPHSSGALSPPCDAFATRLRIITDQLPMFDATLLSSSSDLFTKFLAQRSDKIKSTISALLANAPSASPDIRELQSRLSSLLAAQKSHAAQLQSVIQEKDHLSERLESAVARYMLAEKKLDRARSAQVAKLEAQAIASSRPDGASSQEEMEGVVEEKQISPPSEAARKEAVALAEKRLEQVEKLVRENVKLTNELTGLQTKMKSLGDDEFATSDLFKTLKTQHHDVINRVNDLEATNVRLREEAKRLQGERTAYRDEADNELRSATIDLQSQLAQSEAEIVRVKQQRDDAIADLGIRKSTVDDRKASMDQLRDLAEARETRIAALEAEAERLRLRESSGLANADSDLDVGVLQQKLEQAVRDRGSLENELRSMEAAWRKASAAANKKLVDIVEAEEKIQKYSAEKGKADQKYFASMKVNEAMKQEMKILRNQDAKSSEIVSQLKEAESSCRSMLISLEKQLAEVKDVLNSISNQHRTAQQHLSEQKGTVERLTNQTTELKKLLSTKDSAIQAAEQAQRQAENDAVTYKAKLDASEKTIATLEKRSAGNDSEEFKTLISLAQCNVCHSNWKNTVIKSCGHVCCKECVEKQITLRSRKCPLCGKVFGASDYMRVTL